MLAYAPKTLLDQEGFSFHVCVGFAIAAFAGSASAKTGPTLTPNAAICPFCRRPAPVVDVEIGSLGMEIFDYSAHDPFEVSALDEFVAFFHRNGKRDDSSHISPP